MQNTKVLMLAELKRFQLEGVDNDSYGLCSNTAWAIDEYEPGLEFEVYSIMQRLGSLWPESTGDIEYPVPDRPYSGKEAYYQLPLYSGEYGAARRRFLAYCIETLTKELK